VNQAQLNLLDSHDVPRALHMLQGDVEALKLALVLLFVLPGVPCVYYGTEAGLSGGAEPDCREAFPWGDPQAWPHDLTAFLASLSQLRREHPSLSSVDLAVESLPGDEGDQGLCLIRGCSSSDRLVVVLNRSRSKSLQVDQQEGDCLVWPPTMELGAQPIRLAPQAACVIAPCL
jgi:neopullulanase